MTESLREFASELWMADGPTVSFYSFPYPTRMAVARLPNRELWIWSPIALDAELIRAVDELGTVAHVVTPNKLHHLFLGDWKAQYPNAQLYAPPGLRKKRADLDFTGDLEDAAELAWAHDIDQVVVSGSFFMSEVVFFHRPSRTVLVGDLIQKLDPQLYRGWRRLAMKLDGIVGPSGSTPRDWRSTFWKRRVARAARDRILAWDAEQLLLAHGTPIHSGARQAIRAAFSWLGDQTPSE